MAGSRSFAALAALAFLSLAPTAIAPSGSYNVLIFKDTAAAWPQVWSMTPGCAVTASSASSLTVECTAPPGFTCDHNWVGVYAGTVTVTASSLSLSSFFGYAPGESVVGSTQCTNGPTVTATATMPGNAFALSPASNTFLFPVTCTATFSPASTGAVQCMGW